MLGDLVDLYRVAIHSYTNKLQVLLILTSGMCHLSLATVVFVASLSAEVKTVIKQQLENVANGWMVNRVARQASRMGCHEFSSELYQSLQTHVASEPLYFRLNCLKEFSQAVLCLSGLEDGDYSAAIAAIAEVLRFYQKGIASLTLALSPSPRTPTEPIPVQNNQQLPPALIPLVSKTNEIEQRVEPHNDYFSTQFLLIFSILGSHTVNVEASVLDEGCMEWKTGPKTTVSIKSLEDLYSQQLCHHQQQQQAQQARPKPAPQRSSVHARFQ